MFFSHVSSFFEWSISCNLAKVIYKHTKDLEIVQRNKKKEKGEFIARQVNSN
jgi:hypothetical protein